MAFTSLLIAATITDVFGLRDCKEIAKKSSLLLFLVKLEPKNRRDTSSSELSGSGGWKHDSSAHQRDLEDANRRPTFGIKLETLQNISLAVASIEL